MLLSTSIAGINSYKAKVLTASIHHTDFDQWFQTFCFY